MPETIAPGASGQAAAPNSNPGQSSGGNAPTPGSGQAAAHAGASKPGESPREAAIRKSAEDFFAKGGKSSATGARSGDEGRGDAAGKDGGGQSPEAPGQAPTNPSNDAAKKPHPNSNEAKTAAKLQSDLDDARHTLRRAGKDMGEVDKLPDTAILMLAAQQKDLDRLAGKAGSQPKADPRTAKPADPDANAAKGTGPGPDDLLPPEPDDDPLAEPSPKPKTAAAETLQASLRSYLDELNETDPQQAKTARDLFRNVRDHYTTEANTKLAAAQTLIKEMEQDLRATMNLFAESRLDHVFQVLSLDFPELAKPEARKALTETYQKRWDPDLTKLIGDKAMLLEDFRSLASREYPKAQHDANAANRGAQPPDPGNTGRGGGAKSLTRDEALHESAVIQARTDLTPQQKQEEIAKVTARMRR